MADYFAWSHIRHHGEKGLKTVKPGTKVSAQSLGLEDEHFNELVEAGSVRQTPWPKGLNPDNPSAPSPNQFRLQQLRNQREEVESELNTPGGSAPAQQQEQQGQKAQ